MAQHTRVVGVHQAGKKTILVPGESALSRIEALEKKTGLSLSVEERAIVDLASELGMMGASRTVCHPKSGRYQDLIDSFVELACADDISKKLAMRSQILEYFTRVTNEEGKDQPDFGYHFGQFSLGINPQIDWQENRNQAYVCLAKFVKEIGCMSNYVQQGFGQANDGKSAAKARYAGQFYEVAKKALDAMANTPSTKDGVPPGGISDTARQSAAVVEASMFPAITAVAPTTQQAFRLLQPASTAQDVAAEDKLKNAAVHEPVDTTSQQAELAALKKTNKSFMDDWWKLWKKYGKESTTEIILKGNSPEVVANGLLKTGEVLRDWANPTKQPDMQSLETFAAQLTTFAPSIKYLNAAQSLMSTAERKNMGAITLRFMEIMTLVNGASQKEIISPDLIDNLSVYTLPAATSQTELPVAVAIAAETPPSIPAIVIPAAGETPPTSMGPVTTKSAMGMARITVPQQSHTAEATIDASNRQRAPQDMSQQRKELDDAAKALFAVWDDLSRRHRAAGQIVFNTVNRKTIQDGINLVHVVFNALETPPKIPNSIGIEKFAERLGEIILKIDGTTIPASDLVPLTTQLAAIYDLIEATTEKVTDVHQGRKK